MFFPIVVKLKTKLHPSAREPLLLSFRVVNNYFGAVEITKGVSKCVLPPGRTCLLFAYLIFELFKLRSERLWFARSQSCDLRHYLRLRHTLLYTNTNKYHKHILASNCNISEDRIPSVYVFDIIYHSNYNVLLYIIDSTFV